MSDKFAGLRKKPTKEENFIQHELLLRTDGETRNFLIKEELSHGKDKERKTSNNIEWVVDTAASKYTSFDLANKASFPVIEKLYNESVNWVDGGRLVCVEFMGKRIQIRVVEENYYWGWNILGMDIIQYGHLKIHLSAKPKPIKFLKFTNWSSKKDEPLLPVPPPYKKKQKN